MDFSKVKEITIPEGKVKEISIGGQVVWKVKPAGILFNIDINVSSGVLRNCWFKYTDASGVQSDFLNNNDIIPSDAKNLRGGISYNNDGADLYINGVYKDNSSFLTPVVPLSNTNTSIYVLVTDNRVSITIK